MQPNPEISSLISIPQPVRLVSAPSRLWRSASGENTQCFRASWMPERDAAIYHEAERNGPTEASVSFSTTTTTTTKVFKA